MNRGVVHNVDVEFHAAYYKVGYCLRLDLDWQPSRSVTAGAPDE
jgi:hypothetical protein